MVEFQLDVSALGGGAPYLAHRVKRDPGLVETFLYVQVCSPFTAAEPVRIRENFILNLDWASVGGVQCRNFSLLAADVEADLLCKYVKSPGPLLDVRMGV